MAGMILPNKYPQNVWPYGNPYAPQQQSTAPLPQSLPPIPTAALDGLASATTTGFVPQTQMGALTPQPTPMTAGSGPPKTPQQIIQDEYDRQAQLREAERQAELAAAEAARRSSQVSQQQSAQQLQTLGGSSYGPVPPGAGGTGVGGTTGTGMTLGGGAGGSSGSTQQDLANLQNRMNIEGQGTPPEALQQQTFAAQQAAADAALQERLLGKTQTFQAGESSAQRAFEGLLAQREQAAQAQESAAGRGFAGQQAGFGREQELAMLQEQSRLKGVGGERTLLALKGLMGAGIPPIASAEGGEIFPGEPSPLEDAEADAALWGRARERTGQTMQGGIAALQGLMAQRGISGSGIEGELTGQLVGRGVGELGEFERERVIDELNAKRRAAELNQRYLLERRGQDVTQRGQTIAQQNALIQALLSGNLF